VNKEDTANAYEAWPPGMAVTLLLFKKLPTPAGATSDPHTGPITLTACRKRGITNSMMMIYGNVIGTSPSRLFEIWPGADGSPRNIVSNGDAVQEDDGTRWTVVARPQTIFDNATLALCVPE